MCPPRIILVFLSATLAGCFLLRGLKAQSHDQLVPLPTLVKEDHPHPQHQDKMMINSSPLAKARSTICGAFSMFIDMASGRYLWRNLFSSSSSSTSPDEHEK